MNHLLLLLIERRLPLLIYPVDTVNDSARSLGLSANPSAAAAILQDRRVRWLDIVLIGERPVLAYGAIGIGAWMDRMSAITR